MSETNIDNLSWLHGLQDYFEFKNLEQEKLFIDQILSVFYAENKANSVKNLCLSDIGDEEFKLSRFNFYFKLLETTDIDLVEVVSKMRQRVGPVGILNFLHKYFREIEDRTQIQDSFSRGQVKSKIWLVEELEKLGANLGNVVVLAGWMGQIIDYFENRVEFVKARVVDMDEQSCIISDYFTNLDLLKEYRVKAVNENIFDLDLKLGGYYLPIVNFKKEEKKSYVEVFQPDTIINTSAEHMPDDWYFNIQKKNFERPPTVVIQSNNLFDVPEHVNCVHSVDHMKKKYPMSEVLYEGELQLQGYKRVMLIGKP